MADTYVTKISGNLIAASEVVPESPLANKLAALATGAFEVVSLNQSGEPDVANPSTKVIYLTKSSTAGLTDPYTEWIYTVTDGEAAVASKWEIIGETSIDLSGYKTKQTAYTASGLGTLKTITALTQNANGEISATASDIQSASTSQKGVVQLAGSIGATVTTENNNAASEKAVRDAINALDVPATGTGAITGFGAGKTLATLTETDGKVAATFQDISITKSQVSDFPTEMTPSSHTHGNITNDGKVGTAADYSVVTTTGGAVTAKSLATSSPTASGNTLSFIDTVSQASDGKITATKKTVSTMGAASSSVAGTAGLVPAPAAGDQAKFLKGDGTWSTVATSDTKVTQTKLGGTETSTYPLLLAPTGQSATTTTTSNFATAATYKPSTNELSVDITGNAATASAAKSGSTLETTLNGAVDSITFNAMAQKLAYHTIGGSQVDSNITVGVGSSSVLASGDHHHGHILNDGSVVTDATIASGDKLLMADGTDGTVSRTSIAFDGSTTTQFLSKKGTWESAPSANNGALKLQINGGTATSKFTANQSGDSTITFATGTNNGTIKVDGTEVAVAGLGSAAYTVSTAYATAAQGTKADSAIQGVKCNTTTLTPDSNKIVTIPVAATSTYGVVTIETVTI